MRTGVKAVPYRCVVALLALLGLTVSPSSCVSDSGSEVVQVFVASSLTDVTEDLAEAWATDSGGKIEVVPGGSNHLAAQIRDGAPADAFLTADKLLLVDLESQGLPIVEWIRNLAHNHLVVARPEASSKRIPEDLYDSSLALVACAPEVPCGAATFARFGELPVDSLESSVRAVVARLSIGEADLGVVYATDVDANPDLVPAWTQIATCPCVTYSAAALTPAGVGFVKFLATSATQAILTGHGFNTKALP